MDQGKQVKGMTQTLNKVNIENLPAGIYIVNIEIDGNVKSQKIIKE